MRCLSGLQGHERDPRFAPHANREESEVMTMYCAKCGAESESTAPRCGRCGRVSFGRLLRRVGVRALDALKDALEAGALVARGPVAGVRVAYGALGSERSLRVGVVYLLVYVASFATGMSLIAPALVGGGVKGALKFGVAAAVSFLVAEAAVAAIRKVLRAQGAVSLDVFIAGVALVPIGLGLLVAGVLGAQSVEVIGAIAIVAVSQAGVTVYGAHTGAVEVPEWAAVAAAPALLTSAAFAARTIIVALG